MFPLKIVAAIPLPYAENVGYWSRDLGLVVVALKTLGHDATFVALGEESDPIGDKPLKLVSRKTMADAAWWQALRADGIILNTWSATRYEDILTAALSAGCPVIEKMDPDGVRSPRIWFWHYFIETWSGHRDEESAVYRTLAGPLAFARACLLLGFPGLLDRRLAACMAKPPVLAVETPIAVERIKRFIRELGEPVPRVVCIPHPVDEHYVGLDASVPRQNKLVSVGRWTAHQKNFSLLLKILGDFLARHPDWIADVVGGLPDDLQSQTARIPSATLSRIRFCGKVEREELAKHYRSAKIFVMSSRYESFNIAAAEALCCGCSVVGPVEIPSIPFFTGRASGTPACRYSARHLGDALCAETEAWNQGWRNPAQISADWLKIVGSKVIAGQIIDAIESLEA